jgi:hypothetical protein
MYTQSTAAFVPLAGGERAEVTVEIVPRDQHQFDLFKELAIESAELEQSGGRFVVTLRFAKHGEASGDSPHPNE